MSDLTLVLGPDWSRFSKKINSADDITAADNLPAYLEFDECAIDGIDDLLDILQQLRAEPTICVIRGQLIRGTAQPCRRLLTARTEDGVHFPATFEEVPRAWLMVDFDSVPEPNGVDFAAEPAKCAQFLRTCLPEPFRRVRCVWNASGSAGFKPGIRLHLWFLLDRALTGDDCKAWLSHSTLPVDRIVYGAVQPHYTADPVISGDVIDPMLERIGVLDGVRERVPVPAELPPDLHAKRARKRELTTVSDSRQMDPFVRVGLARWENDHPWADGVPDLSERFECPACGSSDGCAVLPDGKLFCHGGKHAYEAPNVGHPANNGYVMHRFEAFERCSWRDVPRRLQELGYYPGAPHRRTRPAERHAQVPETNHGADLVCDPLTDGVISELATSAAEEMSRVVEGGTTVSLAKLKRARAALSECAKHIHADPERAEEIAFAFARKHVPESFTPGAARRGLIDGARLFDADVETAIERGIERAAVTPDEERVSPVSLDMYGKPDRSIANVTKLLSLPDFADTLAFDERLQQVILRACPPWLAEGDTYPRVLSDADYPAMAVYLADRCDYPRATVSDLHQAVPIVALGQPCDPVLEYLEDLPAWPDGLSEAREACGLWLHVFGGAADDAYTRAVSMRWLVAAVARVYEPGCAQREVLTLIGPQNIGKSRLLQALCGARWFKDDLNLHRNPEMGLLGNWIVELAEIDKLTAQDRHGELKAFISTAVDKYRAPYARTFVSVPRRSVFAGTANPEQIFRDPTGNTRFNVVPLSGDCDVAGLAEARDELWSAARMLYKAGEPWWLQADERPLAVERQEDAREHSDAEELLRELLEHPMPAASAHVAPGAFHLPKEQLDADRRVMWITSTQLHQYLTGKHITRGVYKQISQVMKHLGWTYMRHVGNKQSPRGYSRE